MIRTYHDPLHKGINLDSSKPVEAMVMALIDTEPFQRLRRVRQLGPAYLTFHGAESSRFTHSLGVFNLSRLALQKLKKIDPNLENHEGLLYASSLLHDIGHAPLSHTGEEVFEINHEAWSARIALEHPEINSVLETFRKGMSESVSTLLHKGKCPNSLIKSLVSSQLDCDRLDYLMRDSYSTGARYGNLDVERIIKALTIAPDGDLAITPKGLMAVEHYLVVRNLMYRSVYNHRINEVCNWILEKLIHTARKLGSSNIYTDKCIYKWLWDRKNLTLDDFLKNDDYRIIYHFQRWSEESSNELQDLCRRFLNRDLLKAINLGEMNNENQLEMLAKARKMAETKGLNPDTTCGLRHQKLHGYLPYRGGLRLWDGDKLIALEKVSPLTASLISPASSAWLIYPREINDELKPIMTSI